MNDRSFRARLRAFQSMRGHGDASTPPDAGFIADLEFLENRDLDLSIRLGGMLAFNALLVTIGTHPISASPGAPLSLDASAQSLLVWASIVGIIPFVVSSALCLRALLIGEEFSTDGPGDTATMRQKLFAAFIRSIDAQSRLLRRSVQLCFVGGVMTLAVWAWILIDKML